MRAIRSLLGFFILHAALWVGSASAQPTATSTVGPVQKVTASGATQNDLLGPFNVPSGLTQTVKSGGTLAVNGTLNGAGAFNLSGGTVTLPASVSGGTTSFQPRDADLDAWALLAPSTKADTSALAAHVADTTNPHAVTKAQVGLANVDNTADADKPVSTAQAAADAAALAAAKAYADVHSARTDNPHAVTKAQVGLGSVTNDAQVKRSEMGAVSGVATLDGAGKLLTTQLPALAVSQYLGTAANQAAMLLFAGELGDWCNRTDTGTVFIVTGEDPTQLSSWTELNYPTAPVTSVAGRTGAVTLGKPDVGLDQVDNTSDLAKPISTATQTALDAKLTRASNLSDLTDAAAARAALGLGDFATATVGAGLTYSGGTLSANVTSVAGRTGAVTLAQADIAGLTTASSPTFAGLTTTGAASVGGTLSLVGSSFRTRIRQDSAVIDFTNAAESTYATGRLVGSTLELFGNNGTGLTIGTTGGATLAGNLTANGTGTHSFSGPISITSANGSGVKTSYVQGGTTAGDYGIFAIQSGSTVRGRLVADASSANFRLDTGGSATGAVTILTGASYATAATFDASQNTTLAGSLTVSGAGASTTSSAGLNLGGAFGGGITLADTSYGGMFMKSSGSELHFFTNKAASTAFSGFSGDMVLSASGLSVVSGLSVNSNGSFNGNLSASGNLTVSGGTITGATSTGHTFKAGSTTTGVLDQTGTLYLTNALSVGAGASVTGNLTVSGTTGATSGSITITSADPAIRFKTTGSVVADGNTYEIRNIGATGTNFLQFRTVNDANSVFTTRAALWNSGGFYLGSNPVAAGDPGAGSMLLAGNLTVSGTGGLSIPSGPATIGTDGSSVAVYVPGGAAIRTNSTSGGGHLYIDTKATDGGSIILRTRTTTALTIDTSQNTTAAANFAARGTSHIFGPASNKALEITTNSGGSLLLEAYDRSGAGAYYPARYLASSHSFEQGNVSISGNLTVSGQVVSGAKTPASATDTGVTGTVCWDTNYIYVCVATNTWKRVAISTW